MHEPMYFVCAILILFAIIIGACVEIITSESDVFYGIFFQEQEMRHVFCTYPEILLLMPPINYRNCNSQFMYSWLKMGMDKVS